MAESRFEPGEIKALIGLLVFSIAYIAFAIPLITSNEWFVSLSPIFAYPIYNVGFILLVILTFGLVFSILKHKYSIKEAFKNGIISWISFSFILDVLQAPFFINLQGETVITNAQSGVNTAVDAFWVTIFRTILPSVQTIQFPTINPDILTHFGTAPLIVNASFLFVLVYGVIPILSLLIAAYFLTEGEFLKVFNTINNGEKPSRGKSR